MSVKLGLEWDIYGLSALPKAQGPLWKKESNLQWPWLHEQDLHVIFEGKRAKSQVRIPNYSLWEILCCPAHNVTPHLCPFIHPLGHTFVGWFCPMIYELTTKKKICTEYYWIWIILTAKDRINLPSIGWKEWKFLPHPHLLPTWWIFIWERPWPCWQLASLAVLS